MRWLPTLLLGLVVVVLIQTRNGPVRHGEAPHSGAQARPWFPLGTGDVQFLGEPRTYKLVREVGQTLFRVEEPGGMAFENTRLVGALRMFLREKLVGLRVGEELRIRFRDERDGARERGAAGALRDYDVIWEISFGEEQREGETWFRHQKGSGSHVLYARSVEELKEKIVREWAREVAGLFSGVIFP